MKNVINIIKNLETTSGTNDKVQIIKDNANNETFVKILKYTYADDKMYGFSDKKLRSALKGLKDNPPVLTTRWKDGFAMLDELASSNINDNMRELTYGFVLSLDEDEQEIWIRVLTKDLRCKISGKTINKTIPNCIFLWEVQQAYSRDKAKLKKEEWIALSLKLNGIRSTKFGDGFKSRQNKPMTGYAHILKDLEALGLGDMVYDGELIRKNVDNLPDNENFRLTTSIVNSDAESKPEIEYVIFDMLPKNEFMLGESNLTFKNRLVQLQNVQAKIDELGLQNVRIAPTYYTGTDHSKVDELLDKVDDLGYEGLMLLRDAPYKCKRNNGILKCKKFKSADCKIIGFEEGEKDFVDKLGSFVIEYKGNSVGVGSGYTLEQREEFWKNRNSYIGRILEVKYKEESKDSKTGLLSLQFPTFVCIREEGKQESYE
jgi:ATP-dependent DNA ligase